MKSAPYAAVAILLGLLVVVFFKLSSIPEVYVTSSEVKYDKMGLLQDLPIWAVKQIKDKEGKLLPREKWEEVLKGRYHLVPVDPSWKPSVTERVEAGSF